MLAHYLSQEHLLNNKNVKKAKKTEPGGKAKNQTAVTNFMKSLAGERGKKSGQISRLTSDNGGDPIPGNGEEIDGGKIKGRSAAGKIGRKNLLPIYFPYYKK